jgi:hypothetical protein
VYDKVVTGLTLVGLYPRPWRARYGAEFETFLSSSDSSFSDDEAMLKSPLLMHALRTLRVVRLHGRRQIAVTAHYIDTFLDVYLKGLPASELKNRALEGRLSTDTSKIAVWVIPTEEGMQIAHECCLA